MQTAFTNFIFSYQVLISFHYAISRTIREGLINFPIIYYFRLAFYILIQH